MRLGNFWGLPAPMAILLFFDNPDLLNEFLGRFTEEVDTTVSFEVMKEFSFLAKILGFSDWESPSYDEVETCYTPDTQVISGKISGGSEIHNAQLSAEIVIKVVERLIAMEQKGDYRMLPEDFYDVVKMKVAEQPFSIIETKKVARKIARSFASSDTPCVSKKALEMGFMKKAPREIWLNSRHIVLNEQQTAVWNWFSKYLPEIKKYIKSCSGGRLEEETIFGISFFDLIKRKPISIKYSVMNIFQRIKSREFARFLPDCVKECAEEIAKYKEALLKHVDFGKSDEELHLHLHDLDNILQNYSDVGRSLLEQAVQSSSIRLNDYKKSDIEMLAELSDRITHLEIVGIDNILGITIDDYEKFFNDCCDIGIYGLNCCSADLFSDSITNISLSEKGKIRKSTEELSEIMHSLQDITALLSTLIPIGTALD